MTFHFEAQRRADAIKARRQAGSRTRRLELVETALCGHFRDGWVCTAIAHPQAPDHHYFVRERAL